MDLGDRAAFEHADRVLSPPAVAIEDLDGLHVLASSEFAVIRQAVRETEILAEASVGYDLRAASVLEAVLDVHGSLMGRVSATGRGEREPLVADDSEADQRVNRRVEVLVVCDG